MDGSIDGSIPEAIRLDQVDPVAVSLPPGLAVGEDAEIAVLGPFRLIGVQNGIRNYEAPSPIRTRALFFMSAPDGMKLYRGKSPLSYEDEWTAHDRAGTWEATARSVIVRLRPDAPPPEPGEFRLVYPKAVTREQRLHYGSAAEPAPTEDDPKAVAPLAPAAFIRQGFQVNDRTRSGLYLPAPAAATWEITLPLQAKFTADIGIIPPEIDRGVRTDGATVEVRVDGVLAGSARVEPGEYQVFSVDLSAWGGKAVRLELRTSDGDGGDTGGEAVRGDYVQIGSPMVYTPKANPRRVVMVFVDTLRRDHVQAYGYARENAPKLAARAQTGVVFEDARTVAPWTLPSSRAVLSGQQPERWGEVETLPEILAAQGWASGAFVGNVYLSTNFDMSDGWGEHGCVNWPLAEVSARRAAQFLERHNDHDALLLVHFMDLHLPYKEPYRYRTLFAQERPDYLPESFLRPTLLKVASKHKKALTQYLLDRYDQNLRYVDDQLDTLLELAGPESVVVFFADHGEEFFDHGDLEHGHSFYDELLRIPLMLWAPGLAARRVDAPVSLLDVVPTILELLGIKSSGTEGRPAGFDGTSLLQLARTGSDPRFDDRPRGFGRPLYGEEGWGVVGGQQKYIIRKGQEWFFDLQADPGEQTNLRGQPLGGVSGAALQDSVYAQMAVGLDRPVVRAWRLTPTRGGKTVEVEVSSPLGIARAWVGDDPLMKSEATVESPDPCTVRIRFDGSKGQQREVYVQPMGDLLAATAQASVRVPRAGMEAVPLQALQMDGEGATLAELRVSGVTVLVNYAAVPVPLGRAVSGMEDEMASDLAALGYIDREESAPEPAPAPSAPAPSPAPATAPALSAPAGCTINAPPL